MNFKLMRVSLICSFVLLMAVGLLSVVFADTFLAYLGYLLHPGIWVVYHGFEVNNHDLLPLVAALLLDILVYWIMFALLLSLSSRIRRGKMEQAEQP
jgi:hypothetical protein